MNGSRLIAVAMWVVGIFGSASAQTDTADFIFISDRHEAPLEAVQVFNDDLTYTAISNAKGQVTLPALPDESYLNFTYVGFAKQRLQIGELKTTGRVTMLSAINELDEVQVVGRFGKSREDIAQQLDIVERKEIQFTNPQTSADAIEQHTGAFVQRSQMGGGSPIIRGFEANKILLVVDGVRMNNAIYRNGHLQNSITVGNSILERIEVLYGAGSLGYGSDAIGGVIHFRTREPAMLDNGGFEVHGGAQLRYSSANNEKTGQADIELQGGKLSSLTSFSYSDFDDLRTGNNRDERFPEYGTRPDYQVFEEGVDKMVVNQDPNVQVGTAYSQYDIMQKLKYKPSEYLQLVGSFQFSNSSDVPRYDNLSERNAEGDELRWAEWHYGPQKRMMGSLKANWFKSNAVFDNAQLIAAHQSINEDRITRRFGNVNREYQEERVKVWSVTMDFEKVLDKRGFHRMDYGLDFQNDDVGSIAFSENVTTLERMDDILTRYPDAGSGMTTFGSYVKYVWNNARQTNRFVAGIRYAHTTTEMQYERTDIIQWPPEFIEGVTNKNGAITGAVGWRGQFVPWLRYRVMASSAFRVPNVDDLAKIRARGGNVLVPNLNLTPERSYTFEGTLSFDQKELFGLENSEVQIDITAYYTLVDDAVIRSNYQLPNGDTLLEVSGDFLRVQANVNAESARVFGISANLRLVLYDHWALKSSFNYLEGESEISDAGTQPLAHIPPNYGRTSVEFSNDTWRAEFQVRYNGFKPLDEYAPGSSDNEDLASPIGSLAWTTLNLYGSYQFTDNLSLTVGLENMADVHYRLFSSGVSAPGRNFIASVNARF